MKPEIEQLESRDVPSVFAPTADSTVTATFEGKAITALGSGPNAPATLTILDYNGTPLVDWQPYGASFTGGLRVATADLNGDGYNDIILGTGSGGITSVIVLDGKKLLDSFNGFTVSADPTSAIIADYHPFGSNFSGGCFVAGIDQSAKQRGEIVVGADSGGSPQVAVWNRDGSQLLASWYSYAQSFVGGVHVACGDVEGNGIEDIVTSAGPGGGPQVNVYSGSDYSLEKSFYAFAPSFNGGVTIAVGALANNDSAQIVASQQTESADVSVWNMNGEITSFLVHNYPYGTHVGISYQRTGENAVEPVLFVAEDNLPVVWMYRGQDILDGLTDPFNHLWIPPGNLAEAAGSTLMNPQFVNVQGGWVS